MDILIVILRIIHIFAGVFWVGAAWLLAFFIGPTALALGADGGKFMGYLNTQRRFPIVVSVAAVLTVLAGWALFFIAWGPVFNTPKGLAFAVGGVLGLIALGIGGGVLGPASLKVTRLGGEIARAGKPPSPEQMAEMSALQKRLTTASLWNAIFASLALLFMALARYA